MKSIIGLSLLSSALLLSCKSEKSTTQSSSATPAIASSTSSCNIGKWTNLSAPINLKMSSEFNSDFTSSDLVNGLNPLESMAQVWNNAISPNTAFFQVPFSATSDTGSSTLANFRDNEMGIYKSHTWFSNVSANALAITQFYGIVKTDATLGTYVDLTHADIIVNYRDFGSEFSMNAQSILNYDLPTVILHEMGHFLGLCHESTANSIMAPYYFSNQRVLKTFDINKIKALYINNKNYGVNAISAKTTALSQTESKPGTEVSGIVELNANGICKHYINGKLVYQHSAN